MMLSSVHTAGVSHACRRIQSPNHQFQSRTCLAVQNKYHKFNLYTRNNNAFSSIVAASSSNEPSSSSSSSSSSNSSSTSSEDFEGLAPEDDIEIPGSYRDAMNANTQLGKAIKDACGELDALAKMENETLTEADALLKKLGYKGSLFDVKDTSGSEKK